MRLGECPANSSGQPPPHARDGQLPAHAPLAAPRPSAPAWPWQGTTRRAARQPPLHRPGADRRQFRYGPPEPAAERTVRPQERRRPASAARHRSPAGPERTSVVSGKRVSVRVDLGGRPIIKKQKTKEQNTTP